MITLIEEVKKEKYGSKIHYIIFCANIFFIQTEICIEFRFDLDEMKVYVFD